MFLSFIISSIVFAVSCAAPPTAEITPSGTTIETRFSVPDGFMRTASNPSSFAHYLRQLPLKPHGSPVLYYDGTSKPNYNTYLAVVNLPIGKKNLHQCADAVIRLRAEYLWHSKQYDRIQFHFTNGFLADYTTWMKGNRIKVTGNNVSWVHKGSPSNTYSDFWQYLETVFMYAGTLSLAKELVPASTETMEIGDVFIQGGSPGHAVIIVDMAIHPKTHEKRFLLAQSYMPAQEIQLLQAPGGTTAWHSLPSHARFATAQWDFSVTDLKKFAN